MSSPIKDRSPVHYRIMLEGYLGREWSEWFGQMAISCEDGQTMLKGPVVDQAALHGLLNRIRDLNLTLLTVERITPHSRACNKRQTF